MKRIVCVFILLILLCPSAVATQWNIPEGAEGIWFIPNLHVQVPVYSSTWSEWQQIVDAKDSALLNTWLSARMIADHFNSKDGDGRWNMRQLKPGDGAYFITPTGTNYYKCYMVALVDVGSWGFTINNKVLQPMSSLDIGNRCCVGSDLTKNYLAVFRYVKTLKQY